MSVYSWKKAMILEFLELYFWQSNHLYLCKEWKNFAVIREQSTDYFLNNQTGYFYHPEVNT